MSDGIWVLVADATQARLFSTGSSKEPLTELRDMLHNEGRSKISELVSDQAGKHSGTGMAGSHDMENKQDIKDRERDIFARQICSALEVSREQKQFHRLYLMAPSHMLGALHKHLGKAVKEAVAEEFDLLVVKASPEVIRDHLPDHL